MSTPIQEVMAERNAYIDQKERDYRAMPVADLARELTAAAADFLATALTNGEGHWESDAEMTVMLREVIDRLTATEQEV